MEATQNRLGHDEDLAAFGTWLQATEGRLAMRELISRNMPLIELAENLYRIFARR